MVDSALYAYHYFDRGLLIYSLNLSNNILRLDAMYGLYLLWFALSMPIDAYNTDRVYEVQPRSRPFTIAVDNYKKGTSYRYQIIGPSFYKVKAKCSVNVQASDMKWRLLQPDCLTSKCSIQLVVFGKRMQSVWCFCLQWRWNEQFARQ